MRVFVLVAGIVAVIASGCDDLAGFSTGPNESYCGSVTLAAPFRTGLSPRVQMRLVLDDATALDGPNPPGTLWTFEAADSGEPERRLIDGGKLRPIPALAHDSLSHLEFGDGRDRSAIFGVSPTDPTADSLIAVLSLRSDQSAEVRLLRGGSQSPGNEEPPEGRRPIFGLFPLTKQPGKCGF
jgi:hypothetical protein